MDFRYIYNLSPEGVAGAAGSDKSVKDDTSKDTTTDGSTDSGKKTEDSTDNKVKVVVDGRVLQLDPAVAHDMLQRGIKAYISEKEAENNKTNNNTTNDDDDGDNSNNKAIKDLTDTVNALKENMMRDKVAAERREFTRTLNSLANNFDLTKNDPEIAKMVEGLVLTEMQANSNLDMEDVYKKKVTMLGKKFQLQKKEYTEEKIKDAQKTRGPSSSGGASPGGKEAEKPKPGSLMNGGIRRQALKRLQDEAAATKGGKFM